jgi:exopolysaccharide biosynthesis polyprenyl glycosylphosphotransferase
VVVGAIDLFMTAVAATASARGAPAGPVAYVLILMGLFSVSGMYSTRLHLEPLGRVPMAIGDVTLAVMTLITYDFMVGDIGITSRGMLTLWATTIAAVLLGRLLASPVRKILFDAGAKRRALIVGSGLAAVLVAEKIEHHPELGLETIGFVDDGPRRSVRGRKEPLLGGIDDLCDVIGRTGAEVVIFGYTHNATSDMLLTLHKVDPSVEVLMMPRYFQFVSAGMRVDDLAGMPLLRINRHELGPVERGLKRAEDVIIGGIAALLLLPFLPFIALAIKLDSPGPVFFSQERIGRRGRPFRMYKFRSMSQSAESDEAAAEMLRQEDPRGLKWKSDNRVTKLGAFLRKSSVDELPQLINVLKGDMSLVGPRPAVAEEVAAYDAWQEKRLTVAPGITGMWQVNGRSDVAFDERIWLDFMYIDSWSLWLDLSILLKTIPAVLSAKGAY